jgi:alpha-L-fucosidase
LLDIGPRADGRIPVIMEERLREIGDWLNINGEAIYGTRPWKQSRQWSTGAQPKVDYNQEFKSAYDVSKLAEKPEAGKAAIDAFFTSKGSSVYAILPRWPGRQFAVQQINASQVKSVILLGVNQSLQWKASGNAVSVELPDLPQELMAQPAWVLKIAE